MALALRASRLILSGARLLTRRRCSLQPELRAKRGDDGAVSALWTRAILPASSTSWLRSGASDHQRFWHIA